jgi:hypothetical protein
MNMKTILNISFVLGFVIMAVSCDDFLDINTDPNAATSAELKKLLSNAQVETAFSVSQRYYLGSELGVFVHHNNIREDANRYASPPEAGGYGNSWTSFYAGSLAAYAEIIKEGEVRKNWDFVGIAKILKVYIAMNMVDFWGDIPFFEAADAGNAQYPKTDKGEDVYSACFTILREAKDHFKETGSDVNLIQPGSADIIYGGDTDKWTALANTLMLRMCNNTRNVKAKIAGWDAWLAEAVAGPRIDAAADFQFPFSGSQSPTDERYIAYTHCYGATQHTNYPSPWLYEMMNGYIEYNMPGNPFGSIVDPRIPYYFYNQAAPDEEVAASSFRDGGFISIFFGDNSAAGSANQTSYATVWGLYPVGGKYDTGDARTVTQTDGAQGQTVQKMFTCADLKFIEAEMMLDGTIAGNAGDALSAAIRAAFVHLNNTGKGLGGAPVAGIAAADIDAYVDAVMGKYNAATGAARKLEIIMTQKWIHDVMNPFESYTDIRRTGYPILFDADSPGYGITPQFADGTAATGPDARMNTYCSRPYPNSLWYPRNEVDRNPNMTQKASQAVKVFWQQ